MIKNYCPSIDILGVNTYGGIDNLGKMIRMHGWEKPYIVTEWGHMVIGNHLTLIGMLL